jgi:hypothetical protein
VWLPFDCAVVFRAKVQLVVPLASWNAPESSCTSTLATLALSDAVPLTVSVPVTVAPGDGFVIPTDGGTQSDLRALQRTACVVAPSSLPACSTHAPIVAANSRATAPSPKR